PNGASLELVSPKGNAALEKFLEKHGDALHHLALRVKDIDAVLARLDARGVPLIDKAGRPGARGHRVAFLHPKAFGGTLLELVEVEVPAVGPNEALVLVMGAGVNFNGVWAARGKPVSVFKMHNEPMHIAGSDASGIVWKVGDQVRRWKVGDEVVIHCNQSCGQCPECNGLDPMACSEQKIWGYETSWGSFAQFTKVQAQQLLKKPRHLGWLAAASYGLTYFTAYRMLVHQAEVTAGDNVLIWGAAGGLGVFAIQICKMLGANPIAVIGGKEKAQLVQSLGAPMWIDRNDFPDLAYHPPETP